MIAKISDKEGDRCRLARLVFSGQRKIVLFLVGEENLKAPAMKIQQNIPTLHVRIIYLNSIVIEIVSLSDMSGIDVDRSKLSER